MGQSLLGGDPAEMQSMATQFTQQSEAVRTTMTALDREASKVGTAWTGPGAERFQGAWQNYRTAFQRMTEELQEAARVINTYRGNIESATR
ncbi:WXG100 family type VII secretion target [Nonomuraea sp. RK-328]|uniref:ESAT-6-like protein n=3 Tax=Nonomuraea TaxID=83681 RepID=A0A7Y6I203_9ACTN|nr:MULTISPECIES: WXG100 family type VII secretion target [Nonomuraea]MBN6056487.1 WXG100 family type VII secretion target [Nonomuraea sp. RK-328]MCP2345965.1 WXG100 family type VII secretion target [Nonomuraea roseoviolacea subsp. carminata]NUW30240.1 WXG100 family type VII secretion target [Nonomuraea montanisoli]NUW40944.1 WXG100 family type VII secretion target [Nonomuraea rhodomycinica]